MDILHSTLALSVYLIAYLTAWFLHSKNKPNFDNQRYQTIDGLRGFLALGVFIHHSYIWYFFLHGQAWHSPESHLYNQLGQSSVALFFMITSFLFVSKLMHSRNQPFDWTKFFISRWFRLAPLYYVSISFIIVIVMYLSNWKIHVPLTKFLTSLFHFGAFTITKATMLNDCNETLRINAGVLWSLPYEWLFYFSLPIIGTLLLTSKPKLIFVFISVFFITAFIWAHGIKINHMISFAGGAIAAFLTRFLKLVEQARKWCGSIVVFGCLWVISAYRFPEEIPCKIALIVLFTIVALGNNLFGLLKNKFIQFLGEMAYSTYLMHGIVLFLAIRLSLGITTVLKFSQTAYVLLITCLTPIVVIISYLGYKFVENPFMKHAKIINKHLESDKSSREFQK